MIYLASPYTHPDEALMEERADAAARTAGKLMLEGHVVYSPVVHCRPIALLVDLPHDWEFWKKFDAEMISKADKVYVLCLDGWKESKGVQAEIEITKQLNKPISYIV